MLIYRAFSNLDELNSILTKELYTKLMNGSKDQSATRSSSSTTNSQRKEQPERSPLMEDPRRGSGMGGVGYIPHNPLRYESGGVMSLLVLPSESVQVKKKSQLDWQIKVLKHNHGLMRSPVA